MIFFRSLGNFPRLNSYSTSLIVDNVKEYLLFTKLILLFLLSFSLMMYYEVSEIIMICRLFFYHIISFFPSIPHIQVIVIRPCFITFEIFLITSTNNQNFSECVLARSGRAFYAFQLNLIRKLVVL